MKKLLAVLVCALCSYAEAAEVKYWVQSSTPDGESHMKNLHGGSWIAVDFDNLTVRGEFYISYPDGHFFFSPSVTTVSTHSEPKNQVVTFDAATGLLTMDGYYDWKYSPIPCRHVCPTSYAGDLHLSLLFSSDRTSFVSSSAFPNTQEVWSRDVPFELHSDPSNNTPPPVPVPAAAWLFGTGLLGLTGLARRRSA